MRSGKGLCRRRCRPGAPLSPRRAESHGFGYEKNGTCSLFAALNAATGEEL